MDAVRIDDDHVRALPDLDRTNLIRQSPARGRLRAVAIQTASPRGQRARSVPHGLQRRAARRIS
jgi:hypothetical protein